MKRFFTENKFLIVLWLITAVSLVIFLGHYDGILIDFGREVYYPAQILKGKVLYKDLFNIYGPFSYLFNAVLYKFFGAKLSVLYGAGVICSFLIVTAVYKIAKDFLSEFLSFSVGVLTVVIGVATTVIFNFTFPYSWGMLYGTVFFMFSLLFLIKSENNPKYLYLASFFAGFALANKYEFIFYALFVVIFAFTKSIKTGIKNFAIFAAIPLLCCGILFLQGMHASDLTKTVSIVVDMAKSKTLTYFYQNIGVYYHPSAFFLLIPSFLAVSTGFTGMIYGFSVYEKNKFLLPFSAVFSLIVFAVLNQIVFIYGSIILFTFAIIAYKKLFEDKKLRLLVISAILVSLKTFWGLIVLSYGTYCAPVILIAFLALLFRFLPDKYQKIFAVSLLVISVVLLIKNFKGYTNTVYKISGNYLFTQQPAAASANELINFITRYTRSKDKILILPEGMMINFLTNRASEDYYNSFIPLYVEVFGEDKLINYFSENKPEYIIFNNLHTGDYYFEYICKDYALSFCGFVQSNYVYIGNITHGFNYLIFKKKTL